jgi:hypothetical protein
VGLTRSGSTLLADGVPVARIQAPVVYDADNREDTRPIKWDVVSRDGQPYIVYTLPKLDGMAAPVVDPTLTLQPDSAAGKDTSLCAGEGAKFNYGTTVHFRLTGPGRGLVEFDCSSVPATAICTGATLYMYKRASAGPEAFTVTAYSVLGANDGWVEGTIDANLAGAGEPCWNAKAADGAGGVTTAWAGSAGMSTAGTDYNAASIGSFAGDVSDAEGTEYSTALTAATAQSWFGAANANYGILLIPSTGLYLCSSDFATSGYRPKLVIDYTLPASGGGMLLLGVG